MIPRQEHPPTKFRTFSSAGLYVLSGCSQPLIVTLLKEAGLADPTCQIYMLFYYLTPAIFIFPLLLREPKWPSRYTSVKACG